jgi:hypothetical protein
MLKICHLLLFVLSLGNIALLVGSAMAEERVRSARFAEAIALFEELKWERAIVVAHQAWMESREMFGPEDMRTFEAEELWLIIRIQERDVAGLSYDDLFPRLWAIEDKSIARREIAYEMTWHYGEPGEQWPNAKHIILTYVSNPNHYIGIYSSELADHLETLREDRICVVLSVTYDAIWEAKSYRIIEIGGMTRWKSSYSYLAGGGVAQGAALPAPWGQKFDPTPDLKQRCVS